jgi:hypothetical protein
MGVTNDGRSHWCGAFAAHAMVEAGLSDTLVADSGLAANWKTWGNRSIRRGDNPKKIPRGAVIVLSPAPGSNTSGHVTFFHELLPGGEKLECLGGNQDDTARLSTFNLSRVVAIRWLDVSGAGAGVAEPDEDETMIVAATIYGEARGEPAEGRVAVANVIMNRMEAQRPHFGATPRAICLMPSQFSCWNPTDVNRPMLTDPEEQATPMFRECLDLAERALAGELDDITDGATHFHATNIATPSWASDAGARITLRVGRHIFYAGVL